jgi:hypothetical protein
MAVTAVMAVTAALSESYIDTYSWLREFRVGCWKAASRREKLRPMMALGWAGATGSSDDRPCLVGKSRRECDGIFRQPSTGPCEPTVRPTINFTRTLLIVAVSECDRRPFTPGTQDILPADTHAFSFLPDTNTAVVSGKSRNASVSAGKMSCVPREKAFFLQSTVTAIVISPEISSWLRNPDPPILLWPPERQIFEFFETFIFF